jgi:hypothetical protein
MTVPKTRSRPHNGKLRNKKPSPNLPKLTPKQAGRIRRITTWTCLASAVALLTLAAFSQLVLLLDPYHRAARNVAALLASQPSLEQNLNTLDIAAATLSDHLALYAAEGIIQSLGPPHTELAVAAFTERGIHSRDAIAFTGMMGSLASEILGLSQTLQQDSLAVQLAPLLAQARSEDGGDSATLNQLYAQIPAALEQINNQRVRLQTVANGAYLIFETPQFQPVLKALEEVYAPPNALGEPSLLYYALAIHSWAELPPLCESLEIQYAGNAVILGDLYSAIREARLQADHWGYFRAEQASGWINQRMAAILSGSAVFLLISFALLLWEGRITLILPRPDGLAWLRSLAAWIRGNPFPRLLQAITKQFDQFTNYIKTQLRAAKHPQRASQPRQVEAALQVIQTGLPQAVKRLNRDRPLRIGGDPLDTIYIPSARPGEIDVWIRPARVGFFIEVVSSEAPVLLNGQPVSGARRLNHGDAIQIHDTRLIFQEGPSQPVQFIRF